MSPSKRPDKKAQALKAQGCLNPHADSVNDPLFTDSDFFDARDLVQIKYEMVRRVRVENQPVNHSAKAFGFSRPSFYQAQALLKKGGLAALMPQKPGPRRSHKLDAAVVAFLQQQLAETPSLRSSDLVQLVRKTFGRTVHPRSVERALARQKKKTPVTADRAARPDPDQLASAYEVLRRQTLEDAASSRRFGLAVLLRQGMRAWMAVQAACTPATKENPPTSKTTVMPQMDSKVRASMVQVLASMSIAGYEEMMR